MKSIVYSSEVLRFVQHAMAYCALVEPETTPVWSRDTVERVRRELALVYTSGLMLPEVDPLYGGDLERTVTEDDYNRVRAHVEGVLGEHDGFLDAQQEEMRYSDIPIGRSTSEILADLYQVLADMTWVFRQQVEEYMEQAITETRQSMMTEWGTDLLAVERQIHDLLSNPDFLCDGYVADEGNDDARDNMDDWLSEVSDTF